MMVGTYVIVYNLVFSYTDSQTDCALDHNRNFSVMIER